MKIRRITIKNFRNFHDFAVDLDEHAVFVGPNGVGKSNLLHALRLVLDPSLPDSARHLRQEDFWDGVPTPLAIDARITIAIELGDFEGNDDQLASLAEYLIETDPMVARLTYVFQAKASTKAATTDDFEFFVFGGDREDNRVGYEVRRRLPLDVFHALRDAENDLSTWRRSPLRPLLERAWAQVPKLDKDALAKGIRDASNQLTLSPPLEALKVYIAEALSLRTDGGETTDVQLGIAAREGDMLIRVVRLLLDDGRRGVADVSLGLANLLFFTLKLLELEHMVADHERDHTFVAIEEPEAHLHPHLQRQMFRSLLRMRQHLVGAREGALEDLPTTILVTTHSPHLASIAPLKSLVLLRRIDVPCKDADENLLKDASGNLVTVKATIAASTVNAKFEQIEASDLERYIEVTRAEMLFARGVILVEGVAEQYLVPKIAALHGTPLDTLGVSVCAVEGTHFTPFVQLLSQLGVPFAVITDGDPHITNSGSARIEKLLPVLVGEPAFAKIPANARCAAARDKGLFVGNETLEIDLLKSGRRRSIMRTLESLGTSGAARKRGKDWGADHSAINNTTLLEDIKSIGKGRFAQRLASTLRPLKSGKDPAYIIDAIDFIAAAVAQ
ncbi:MAG: hypothetical protein AUK47_15035 [Deltaproteobacteria bacterium CG2_30_63_29]|nr:MAG: hypothetical protein AUK47_15035 [Deltaproteobacteria bacterium CG2_30_63_29]PJB37868.1 MAG: ATP-dependent endonuclease [Deltaproteobacteria bacterium CG_4_9_14_3_um_filter_63_12]